MADREALVVPEGSGAVSANASPDESSLEALGPADVSVESVFVENPRLCLVCQGELLFDERKVCRGRCARTRKTLLQKNRREARRVWLRRRDEET
jgi:hypothetical protein